MLAARPDRRHDMVHLVLLKEARDEACVCQLAYFKTSTSIPCVSACFGSLVQATQLGLCSRPACNVISLVCHCHPTAAACGARHDVAVLCQRPAPGPWHKRAWAGPQYAAAAAPGGRAALEAGVALPRAPCRPHGRPPSRSPGQHPHCRASMCMNECTPVGVLTRQPVSLLSM